MSNRRPTESLVTNVILAEDAPLEERVAHLNRLRTEPEISVRVDASLLEQLDRHRRALREAQGKIKEAEALVDKLTAPPWFPATFVQMVETSKGQRAYVREGAATRLVGVDAGVDPATLARCDLVYLSQNQNLIMGRIPTPTGLRLGESGAFKYALPDGRVVVTSRGQTSVMLAPPGLGEALHEGDEVVCDATAAVAAERLPSQQASHLFVETPKETFADVGGLPAQISEMKEALTLHWRNPALVAKYGLRRIGAMLLCGPSGTGKTLLARAFAHFYGTLVESGESLFISVKPGELHSSWYSESEKAYRDLFALARAKATPTRPVVLFFDELDAIGMTRGHSHMRVHDNVLTAFLAELDGLSTRGNLLVIAATNRRDALDAALLRPGRFGDLILDVPRPNRAAAHDIFCKHLRAETPIARNGHGADLAATRKEIIESALSRIYSPNGESELATITFRDGTRRAVKAAELTSGAVIANIVRKAINRACKRELLTGDEGVTCQDVLIALAEQYEVAARGLTPLNCRDHLTLPQDMDVTKVEVLPRKAAHPQQFLTAA